MPNSVLPARIFTADDEFTCRLFVEQALLQAGYEVTSFASGAELLRRALEEPPDLILLDALMPEPDGLTTCRLLKQTESTREVPVLFLSATKDAEAKLRAFEAGAVDFLSKPADPAELRARVKTHLQLGRKWRSLAYRARSEGILLQELIHAVDDILFILQTLRDEEGAIVEFEVAYANARAYQELGESPEKIIGHKRADLGLFGHSLAHEDLASVVTSRQTLEREVRSLSGTQEKFYRITLIPLENDLVAVFFRDVTSFKHLQAERDANLRAAMQSERLATLGTLAAGVGHEINNPNNVLSLNLPLLQTIWKEVTPVLRRAEERGELSTLAGLPTGEMLEEIPRMLAAMNRASQRIKQIVRLLRDYVRGGASPGVMQNLSVNDVVQAALELVGPHLRSARANFQMNLAEGLPQVRGDAGRLEQAVINLLKNAAEALTQPGQAVVLTTQLGEDGTTVEIVVRDEGAGMTPEVLARMRDPFFTTKHDSGGTGLGVAIVHRIADEHGGSLEYQSAPGAGTTARLVLPMAPRP